MWEADPVQADVRLPRFYSPELPEKAWAEAATWELTELFPGDRMDRRPHDHFASSWGAQGKKNTNLGPAVSSYCCWSYSVQSCQYYEDPS